MTCRTAAIMLCALCCLLLAHQGAIAPDSTTTSPAQPSRIPGPGEDLPISAGDISHDAEEYLNSLAEQQRKYAERRSRSMWDWYWKHDPQVIPSPTPTRYFADDFLVDIITVLKDKGVFTELENDTLQSAR